MTKLEMLRESLETAYETQAELLDDPACPDQWIVEAGELIARLEVLLRREESR